MPGDDTLKIVVSLHNSGCLPVLLRKEIWDMERRARVCGQGYTPETAQNVDIYLQQLRACLAAVEAARGPTSVCEGKSDAE